MSTANKNLRDTLVRLNLCSDRDFRRCRRIVRRLARGIPAFDFVWIDALVQTGSLTPYQAKVLQSAPPEQLCVGPCVLLERLGSSADSETYRARSRAGEIVVLKRLRSAADELSTAAAALADCLEKARGLESPFVAVPYALSCGARGAGIDGAGPLTPSPFPARGEGRRLGWEALLRERSQRACFSPLSPCGRGAGGEGAPGAIVLVSRFVSGSSCKELLVRRGRFPADVVAEIARQVAHGSAALEARTILHGQITLANVRIASAGNAVLVDAGIGSALSKSVLIRDDVPPELYDAVAPERIGTGNPITTATDIYAFGCLLWQLLAGRPPFPTGDPLAKLAAHQSRGIPDVRTIAPDVPAPLAEAVRACTHADPEQRPASFAEIARRFGAPQPSGRQRLLRFLRRFDGAALPDQLMLEKPARFPTSAVVLAAVVLCGATLFLFKHGATGEISRAEKAPAAKLAAKSPTPGNPVQFAKFSERQDEPFDTSPLLPLPPPNADGVIELADGPYAAEKLTCVGDLVIRGKGPKPATIEIRDHALVVRCRKFSLEHVIIRQEMVTSGGLLEVYSQELAVTGCTFRAEIMSADGSTFRPRPRKENPEWSADAYGHGSAIEWAQTSSRDPDAGRIRVSDTVFATERDALTFRTPPTRIEIENCLGIGGGFLYVGDLSSDHDTTVVAQHLTLRRAPWLCRLLSPSGTVPCTVRLVLQDSAFDLKGSAATLVRLVSSTEPSKARRRILVTGRDSLIDPNIPIAAWCRPHEAEAKAIDSRGAVVEGLAVGEFQFVGPEQSGPSGSAIELRSLTMPRQSDDPPGIVAARLASATGSPNRSIEQSAH